MADLSQFSKRIKAIAATVERRGPAIVREVATVALQTVVIATPVGNKTLWGPVARARVRPGYVGGRARANWMVGIYTARLDTTTERDAGGAETIQRGKSIIEEAFTAHEIHITNNLKYIVPLNDGHSHQAPAGFVQLAVANALEAVKRAKITEG